MTDEIGLLWRRQDVRLILIALSNAGKERHPEYQAALADAALAFGISFELPQPYTIKVVRNETN